MGEGQLCKHEFNAQMQAMQSRVDNLETNVRQQMLVTVNNAFSVWKALVAGGVTAPAAAKYLADPFVAALLLGYVSHSTYEAIMGFLNMVPGFAELEEIFTDLVLIGLGINPYGPSLIESVSAKLYAAISAAQQALDDALGAIPPVPGDIAEAIALLAAAQRAAANAAGMFTALNNVSACKVASNVFQAAVL